MKYLAFVLCASCSYAPTAASGTDPDAHVDSPNNNGDASDSGTPDPPLHLDPTDGMPGSGSLVLSGTVVIDTSGTPSINVPLGDATLDVRPQLGGGADLAVLHVGKLTVASGASVRVVGTRPFVVIAGGDVAIAGQLDGGARGGTPGAGGALPGTGTGAGAVGHHGENDSDTGGGGAGCGTTGAAGGAISGCTVAVMLGAGGGTTGDATISQLIGGSGGGPSSGTTCAVDSGGAGGGALQITSATRIDIASTGRINVGGGGGNGGTDCGAADVNSGAGGGSGGAIVLQAPAITNAGTLAANGGGGGGSSSTGHGSAMDGQDGQPSATVATGGSGFNTTGGSGGGLATPNTGGNSGCGTNAGGGGGAAGRIAASAGFSSTGTVSPAANVSLPP